MLFTSFSKKSNKNENKIQLLEGWQSLAECTGLENQQGFTPFGGSNPSPSAFHFIIFCSTNCSSSHFWFSFILREYVLFGNIKGALWPPKPFDFNIFILWVLIAIISTIYYGRFHIWIYFIVLIFYFIELIMTLFKRPYETCPNYW